MNATVGDRFLDTRGQTWTVLDSGQLQNTLAPGVLIRSWDSLDTCLGPLTRLREHEPGPLTPGDKYADRDGDVWTVGTDWLLRPDGDTHGSFYATIDSNYGPLTKETDMPKPGDKYRDSQGDVWTVQDDGLFMLDGDDDEVWDHRRLDRAFGPLTPLADDGQPGPDMVNNPPHYQTDSGIEAIDVIDAFFPDNYNLGSVFKYTSRAGKKDDAVQDLKKSRWYLDREIARLGG